MNQLKGILSATALLVNSLVLVPLLLVFAVIKLMLPIQSVRIKLSKVLVWIAELWVFFNTTYYRLIHGNKIKVLELPELSTEQWYLVVANHRSTADIPVLQTVFNKKIPFLKFFIKQELIWVPLLGLAWWALDFPFMKRYSKGYLQKNPHLKGKDFEQTKKSCEKFKNFPTSVINFIEGTRFNESKHSQQESPYQYLLKPKAGGIGYVMGSLGKQVKQMLLVTLAYQGRDNKNEQIQGPSFWDYLCGNYEQAVVKCEKIVIPEGLLNKNYQTDAHFKTELFKWCEQLWYKQDSKLKEFYERTNI
jgi:1-acyl-sn-glycerol-3-phosphate acyltransferase